MFLLGTKKNRAPEFIEIRKLFLSSQNSKMISRLKRKRCEGKKQDALELELVADLPFLRGAYNISHIPSSDIMLIITKEGNLFKIDEQHIWNPLPLFENSYEQGLKAMNIKVKRWVLSKAGDQLIVMDATTNRFHAFSPNDMVQQWESRPIPDVQSITTCNSGDTYILNKSQTVIVLSKIGNFCRKFELARKFRIIRFMTDDHLFGVTLNPDGDDELHELNKDTGDSRCKFTKSGGFRIGNIVRTGELLVLFYFLHPKIPHLMWLNKEYQVVQDMCLQSKFGLTPSMVYKTRDHHFILMEEDTTLHVSKACAIRVKQPQAISFLMGLHKTKGRFSVLAALARGSMFDYRVLRYPLRLAGALFKLK